MRTRFFTALLAVFALCLVAAEARAADLKVQVIFPNSESGPLIAGQGTITVLIPEAIPNPNPPYPLPPMPPSPKGGPYPPYPNPNSQPQFITLVKHVAGLDLKEPVDFGRIGFPFSSCFVQVDVELKKYMPGAQWWKWDHGQAKAPVAGNPNGVITVPVSVKRAG